MPTIVEIKARCDNPARIKSILEAQDADLKGVDHQIDTYFRVKNGRLKLREGNIENYLIHYHRPNQSEPKTSQVLLYKTNPNTALKALLVAANGILTLVDKKRAIYFIKNVKFHLDEVQGLGSFVEIEAIDNDGNYTEATLLQQCQYYMRLLDIQQENLLDVSYSDLLLQKTTQP